VSYQTTQNSQNILPVSTEEYFAFTQKNKILSLTSTTGNTNCLAVFPQGRQNREGPGKDPATFYHYDDVKDTEK
jgi:hypothetical protein